MERMDVFKCADNNSRRAVMAGQNWEKESGKSRRRERFSFVVLSLDAVASAAGAVTSPVRGPLTFHPR